MTKKLLALGGAAALVAGTTGIALAASDEVPGEAGRSVSAAVLPVVKCDGGRSVNVRTRQVNGGLSVPETPDMPVDNAQLLITGPPSGVDTVVITFSAESRLFGAGPGDIMTLKATKDGADVAPTDGGNVIIFTDENSYGARAAQFCTRVGPGTHLLRIHAGVFDAGADGTLTGWLDDYQVTFDRYE